MRKLKGLIALILSAAILFSCTAAFAGDSILGVDISYHNGTVSFTDLQSNGKDFAMIRLGYYNKLDKNFEQNIKAAEEAEIEYGVYLYSYAYSDAQAETEANFVVETLSKYCSHAKHFTLPVAYDLEDQKMIDKGLTKAQITNQMNIFCGIIRDAGYTPMVYANRNWLTNYIDLNEIVKNDYKIWYAYWPSALPFDFSKQIEIGNTKVKADMWQYFGADEASSTVFDLNVIYDAASLITPRECNHSFDIVEFVSPTTQSRGYTLHTCSKCGREFKTNFITKLPVNGWNLINDRWYYYADGTFLTGWARIKNQWYYFNASGVMQTGWQKLGSTWYYLDENGAMQTGWINLDSVWYYCDENGAMKTGWQYIDGKWYYFSSNGDMAKGWHKFGSSWYYFKNSGAMAVGWQKIGSEWYYFNSNGTMYSGWLRVSGKWFYFDLSGKMLAGTQKLIDGRSYRFNSSGVCLYK